MPQQVIWRSWTILGRSTRPSSNNTQKRGPFHYRWLECKSRKSRDSWSNRQIWLWSTKWSTAKANRLLPRKRTGHRKHPLPTTQEKTLQMYITRWSILKSHWLYFFCSQRWRSSMLLLLLSHFSCVWLCVTPETAAHQAPLSLGFSRQEHWSGLPFPSPMHESEKWKWSLSVVSDS